MEPYENRQFSPWPLAAMAFFGVWSAKHACQSGRRRAVMPSLGLSLMLAPFCALSTRVDALAVSWYFGFGFPSGSIPLAEIVAVEPARTSLWEGYGIHWTLRHGWLWNAAGRDAVLIRKRDGGTITLGSDDAPALYAAISSRLTA